MKLTQTGWVGAVLVSVVMGGGLVIGSGCGTPEDEASNTTVAGGDEGPSAEALRWRRPRPRPSDAGAPTAGGTGGNVGTGGGTGGTSGSGSGSTTADCAVCTAARVCCEAVTSGPLCNVSAETCSSRTEASRPGYVRACRTLLTTIRGAWIQVGVPPACSP